MECQERERLWSAYESALDVFCDAVDCMSASSRAALGARIIATSAAKDLCVKARKAWENHLHEHGCDEARKYFVAGSSVQK